MGGSSAGGINFKGLSNSALPARSSAEDAAVEAFQTELGGLLGDLLASYNHRDHALVEKRVAPIAAALCGEYSGTMDRLFGGSVAKHTYVDGLSDIDCLITIDGSDLADHSPAAALKKIAATAEEVSGEATVKVGRMTSVSPTTIKGSASASPSAGSHVRCGPLRRSHRANVGMTFSDWTIDRRRDHEPPQSDQTGR